MKRRARNSTRRASRTLTALKVRRPQSVRPQARDVLLRMTAIAVAAGADQVAEAAAVGRVVATLSLNLVELEERSGSRIRAFLFFCCLIWMNSSKFKQVLNEQRRGA